MSNNFDYEMEEAIKKSLMSFDTKYHQKIDKQTEEDDFDYEDFLLQEAVNASLQEVPRNLIEEQNMEYEKSLEIDRIKEYEKIFNKEIMNENRKKIDTRDETKKEQEEIDVEITTNPPSYKYDVNEGDKDIISIRCKLPDSKMINLTFNKNEPLLTLVQMLRYKTNFAGHFKIIKHPNQVIKCSYDTPLIYSGLEHREVIYVELTE